MFTRIIKTIWYGFLTVTLLFATALTVVYVYQDEVIALIVSELNKNLRTKVDVGKIELSLLEKFPHVSLSFHQLTMHGAIADEKQPLAKAERLHLTFDFWDILRKQYAINQVFLENADVYVLLDKNGNENYQIFRRDSTTTGGTNAGSESVNFDLEKIHLKRVSVTYANQKSDQEYALYADRTDASLRMRGETLLIAVNGAVHSQYVRLDDHRYFADKSLSIDSQLEYDLGTNHLVIRPSTVGVGNAEFLTEGTFANHSDGKIDLRVRGKQSDIQTILSLLPTQYAKRLATYQSRGKVYFDAHVSGATMQGATPAIDVAFGCENASFYHADANKTIESAYLTGRYDNGRFRRNSTSTLSLNRIRGTLDGRPFEGAFSMNNFDNPHLRFTLTGEFDATSLLAFYPAEAIQDASGTLKADISFEGTASDLRTRGGNRYVRTSGTIQLRDLAFRLRNKPWAFAGVTGDFLFDKSDLQVHNLAGNAGRSDFRLDGYFKNVMAYLLFDDQDLTIDAQIASRLLNLDELLAANDATPPTDAVQTVAQTPETAGDEQYQLTISPRLALNITGNIAHAKFRRFRANDLQGNLRLANQVATSPEIRLRTAGGQMAFTGTVDARQPDRIAVDCKANFNQLAIDSIFYAFENFQQTFIQDRHLRGNVTSDVTASMTFDRQLTMDKASLMVSADTRIANGELKRFEPMRRLSGFIKRQELANIQFSELQNTIRIENQRIIIPEMEIRSNVTNISVKGTHTFDQVMDYRLRIPMYTFVGRRAHMANDTGPDSEGVANLFLSIRGTADNYKIAYDKEAVREKVRDDWQEEKQEFNDIFKSKQKKSAQKKSTKPKETEESFFDW